MKTPRHRRCRCQRRKPLPRPGSAVASRARELHGAGSGLPSLPTGFEEALTEEGAAFKTCAMKKVFDQTVRDLKREVNKKVLKIPGVEQKILDATSNEPWGPHGKLLADLAHATRNYHEYQIIMTVIWKRINDTGKNWQHVNKDCQNISKESAIHFLKGH